MLFLSLSCQCWVATWMDDKYKLQLKDWNPTPTSSPFLAIASTTSEVFMDSLNTCPLMSNEFMYTIYGIQSMTPKKNHWLTVVLVHRHTLRNEAGHISDKWTSTKIWVVKRLVVVEHLCSDIYHLLNKLNSRLFDESKLRLRQMTYLNPYFAYSDSIRTLMIKQKYHF